MGDWQFEFINSNLEELIQVTKCNKILLFELRNGNVLDDQDLKTLNKEWESHGERAATSKLYAMLRMRPNAYQGLLHTLQKVNQRLAAEILERGWNSQQPENSVPKIPGNILSDNLEMLQKIPKNSMKKVIDPQQETPLKFRGPLPVLVATAAAATFASIFFTVYFIYYINLSIPISMVISSAIGILLLALNLKFEFSRATVLLIAPELTARTVRIGFVHLLMILSPLPHLQSNSEQFVGSIVCTTERVLNVAKTSNEGVLRNAMGGFQASVQSINELSHKIEQVISDPFVTLKNISGVVESVLGEIGKMEDHCDDANSGVSRACTHLLDLSSGVCNGISHDGRRRRDLFGKFKGIGKKIGDGVSTGIDHIRDGVNTGRGHAMDEINTGMDHITDGIQQGMTGARDGLLTACNSIRDVSSQCSQIQKLDMCSVFSPLLSAEHPFRDFRENIAQGLKHTFHFRLETKSGGNSSVNEESLDGIKNSFRENVQSKIDFFLAFQRIWGSILGLSFVYLVIRKGLLVRKYVKKQPIRCKPVSLFFLVTNPFTLQICFLFLIGMFDYSIYMINDIFRSSILANEVRLGVEFNASVTITGGDIGKQIVGGIIRAFELHKFVNTKVSFEVCFEQEMDPPNWLGYLMALGLSAIGLVTYVVDMYSRKRQREMIQFAYNRPN